MDHLTETMIGLCVWLFAVPGAYLVVLVVLRRAQMLWWRNSLVALEIHLPVAVKAEEVARWFAALRTVLRARRWWSVFPRSPVVLEICATRQGIGRIVLVPRRLQPDLLATLSAVVPGARLTELGSYRDSEPDFRVAAHACLVGVDGLLNVERADDTNRHLLAALQPLENGEQVRVQWLLAGARDRRAYLPASLPPADRRALGERWMCTDPMLLVVCRVAVASPLGVRRARAVYGRVWAALRGLDTPLTRIVRQRMWPNSLVARRVHKRHAPLRRWPLLLTAKEIAGLVGFANRGDALPGVPLGASRTLPPASQTPSTGLVLAASNYPGLARNLCFGRADRLRHTWMLGPTGSGKSTLMGNMISYDMRRGDGLILIDARADLVADVLNRVPDDRRDDVIVLDPAATGHVVGFNPLEAGHPEQAASFVYHVLHSLFAASWGPRTADILRASLLTLASTRASNGLAFTLIDIPDLLTNPALRRSVLSRGVPPQVGSFWSWYESVSDAERINAISPVLNKLRTFTMSTPLRLMLGQSGGISFADVLAHKRIVVVPLKKGLIGSDNAALVGSLVMTSIWQTVMARAAHTTRRRPFWLYLDEFHDLVRLPIDLSDMLAQARGFGLGLVLAHQYLGQLSPHLKSAVLASTRTQLVFQLSHGDAREVVPTFAPLSADDLRHLGPYEIAMRLCVSGATLSPVTGTTYPLVAASRDGQKLARVSTQRWGTARAHAEVAITSRIAVEHAGGRRLNRIPVAEHHAEG